MKFLLSLILVAVIGVSIAWKINYDKFGQYEASFAAMKVDGEIDGDNYVAYMEEQQAAGIAVAETPNGTDHDFGVMAPEEKGEHSFVIRNAGQNPLTLELGATTCKCTLGNLKDSQLGPGEETEVQLTWTVNTSSKTFGQSAEIRTNDPQNVAIRFEISGRVVRDLEIEPDAVSFGEVAAGEPFSIELNVYNYQAKKVELSEPKLASELLHQLATYRIESFEPNEENAGVHASANQGFKVIAEIAGGMRQGALQSQLSVAVADEDEKASQAGGNDDSKKYVSVNIGGRITGVLEMVTSLKLKQVRGGYIYTFGRLKSDSKLSAGMLVRMRITGDDETKLRIGDINLPDHIKASLTELSKTDTMQLYKLDVDLIPGDEAIERMGKTNVDYGTIMIDSDNPQVSSMKIAIKFALDAR